MNHRPSAIGLALCDHVIVEADTHNVTPVNCFNSRALDTLPGETTFFVLAWLADGIGKMLVELVIERLDTFEEIYRINRQLVFHNRLQEARFVARIRDCTFPIAGYYQVSLSIERELIAQRKFRVAVKGEKK